MKTMQIVRVASFLFILGMVFHYETKPIFADDAFATDVIQYSIPLTTPMPTESDDILSHIEALSTLTDISVPAFSSPATPANQSPRYPFFTLGSTKPQATALLPIVPISKGFIKGISTYFSAFHPGIDIMADVGTPIHAMLPGIVESVGFEPGGYGNFVIISHIQNTGRVLYTLYAHMRNVDVHSGQTLSGNDQIGEVGLTGHTTGPHVHFEIHDSDHAIDPLKIVSNPQSLALAK